MRVLLTNDDGIYAPGLRILYSALRRRGHTVHVVAPMAQQSGVGHSLTVFSPLRGIRFKEADFEGFGLYGTPADCVKLALGSLLHPAPDLVMSGINAGANVGPDILYSGTVGAATEACHELLPSMAVSNDEDEPAHLPDKALHAVRLAEAMDWKSLPPRRLLNVNYPAGPLSACRGLRVCPQTDAVWQNSYDERRDPRGDRYWWLVGSIPPETVNAGTDKDLLGRGYITLTPLCFNFTDEEGLEQLKDMPLPDPAKERS